MACPREFQTLSIVYRHFIWKKSTVAPLSCGQDIVGVPALTAPGETSGGLEVLLRRPAQVRPLGL